MDDHASGNHVPVRRPLRECQPRAATSPMQGHLDSRVTSHRIPHHESLKPEGHLSLRKSKAKSPVPFVENKRLSAIADESQTDSRRNSAISTNSSASGARPKRKTHIGPWQLGRTLGKGATGRVRLAKHALTGQIAAVKIVSKKSAAMVQSASMARMDKESAFSTVAAGPRLMPFGIEREVVIMKLITHPNIIRLYDVWENRGELYLVLEYVEGGELFEYVSENRALHEEEAVRLFRQIIAGLSYCHRFNICHRDLKPENLLLDADGNMKLADFGMAALQPRNRLLNTSCGSPHYAAPEIISGKSYSGDKVDAWSSGIILYAMLNGHVPFDGEDTDATLRLVLKGEYYLSKELLSLEARDLIQRILQANPENRIRIDQMWEHPLLKKYEARHRASGMPETSFGPLPPLTVDDYGLPVTRRSDIDPELLGNLTTLWHGARQEEIIGRLLSNEPNQEKLFYNALLKFRDVQLEDYSGSPPLEYSASDYHHIPQGASKSLPNTSSTLHIGTHARKRSQLSIFSDDNPKPAGYDKRSTSANTGITNTSYDPYRASRNQIVKGNKELVVVRKRNTSITSNRLDVRLGGYGATATHKENGDHSIDATQRRSVKRASRSTNASRSSLASSHRAFSGGSRRSASYKRHVVFPHGRRSSGGSTLRNYSRPSTATTSGRDSYSPAPHPRNTPSISESCSMPFESSPPSIPRQPRRPASELDIKKQRAVSHFWKEDTRQVSSELSKICEEAFNRSSVSSSGGTQVKPVNSPGTTMSSILEPMSLHPRPLRLSSVLKNRPLPEPPTESLGSMTVRELAETRRRLLQHCQASGSDKIPAYLKDVISNLDRLMQSDETQMGSSGRRSTSHAAVQEKPFQVASREQVSRLDFHKPMSRVSENWSPRTVSEPLNWRNEFFDQGRGRHTVRLVSPEVNQSSQQNLSTGRKDFDTLTNSIRGGSKESLTLPSSDRAFVPRTFKGLDTIEEDPRSPRTGNRIDPSSSRKRSWFKRRSDNSDDVPPPPPEKDDEELRMTSQPGPCQSSNTNYSRNGWPGLSGEILPNDPPPPTAVEAKSHKKWFSKVFKRPDVKKYDEAHDLEKAAYLASEDEPLNASRDGERQRHHRSRASQDMINLVSPVRKSETPSNPAASPSNSSLVPSLETTQGIDRTIQPSQNWFAKFFHLRPATKLLCVTLSRIRARKEVTKILRKWKRYGVRDVITDAQGGTVFGRVDAVNYLMMKPVEFAGEFFSVVEHYVGGKGDLCVIRMTQEKGAASSFFKVVETLQGALQMRGHLVRDKARRRDMERELARSGL